MFARLLSEWGLPRYESSPPSRVRPPVKDYKLARAKSRKQKRKSGGPR